MPDLPTTKAERGRIVRAIQKQTGRSFSEIRAEVLKQAHEDEDMTVLLLVA